MVYYFSGTGNSRYVAERTAQALGETPVSLNDIIKKGEALSFTKGETLVFCVPTYAWRIPRVVEDKIRNARSAEGCKAYFVMTCGGEISDSAKYAAKLCSEKGMEFMGCAQVVMPENYIAMFGTPSKSEAEEIIKRAEPVIDLVAEIIKKGTVISKSRISLADSLKSDIINTLFYPLCVSAKKFRATQKCISCGLCEKLCPLNNISLSSGRPVWGKDCTHCMACISYCPEEAIEYGTASVGKERYRCGKSCG